jgi:hypothetical protein
MFFAGFGVEILFVLFGCKTDTATGEVSPFELVLLDAD